MSRRILPLLCLLPALAASAQRPAPAALHYETVSIHEARRVADGSITMSGGIGDSHIARVDLVNWKIDDIVGLAFGSEFYRIEGIPDTLDGRMYVLRAQAGDETNALLKSLTDGQAYAAQQRMLREAVIERFHLHAHAIDREMSGFLLLAGPHLRLHASIAKPLVPGDGRTEDVTDLTQPSYGERCEGSGCTLTARGQSMEWLAGMLERQWNEPVTNRTSLSGLYDFTLKWSPRSSETEDDRFPPLETAVAEQLGLKLGRGKSSQRILIIDHLEAPSTN